ncbi:MAG TPA: uroporphyrinogen-III synthase [Pseudonocardiaceae bacterium]
MGRDMIAPSAGQRSEPLPLAGFTVGVTAARRAEELGALLQRKGAEVLHAPAIRIVPLADDTELHAATKQLISHAPDVVVVTTGIGFRGWVEAADGWGLGETLVGALRRATLLARGPKARGAIRAAGLTDAWSPPSESSAEVLEHLLADDLEGVQVAVQLHGEPLPDFVDALGCAGANVVQVPVYRWAPPDDLAPLDRLLNSVLDGGVDAVSFTSAPAVASMLSRARELGVLEALVQRLRREVIAACVGPVTAGPLVARDVPTVQPQRSRIGALVRTMAEVLPARAPRWPVAGHVLELRGHAAVVDGVLCAVPPTPMALLRLLAARPGRVVARADLLSVMPTAGDDEHAVETAVARLRAALGTPRLVQTVVKRGYRLALEPGDCR